MNRFLLAVVLLAVANLAWAGDPIPSAEEVQQLLLREPFAEATWPTWRRRLLEWIDVPGRTADAAYEASRLFIAAEVARNGDRLPAYLERDGFAWYTYGRFLEGKIANDATPDAIRAGKLTEDAYRAGIRVDPKFARLHRNLARVLILQPGREEAAEAELTTAKRLDPKLAVAGVRGEAALRRGDFTAAEQHFREAMAESPNTAEESVAGLAYAICGQQHRPNRTADVAALAAQYPANPALVALHGMAHVIDGNPRRAKAEFARARALGIDPAVLFGANLVATVEAEGGMPWWEIYLYAMGAFLAVYAAIMLAMALVGLLLAGRTRGARSEALQHESTDEMISAGGQVRRIEGETFLAKLYVAGLFVGLILFYVAVPFLLAGVIGLCGVLLMLIFSAGRIPIKLVIGIVVIGALFVFSIVRSVFAKVGTGAFGVLKSAAEEPRLYQLSTEVADKVDTAPVDEIYLAPGSAIGVHQEGRGPFGMFGSKKRVLTLGLATMHDLTVGELKAILAHEYAHFSHADTLINRFVFQVTMTMGQAADGMRTGGWLDYINPFMVFIWLYSKAFGLLSAGYSRSREFLADRMAAVLYGPQTFRSALAKVSTEGSLFEMTIYDNIQKLLDEQKAFINMYTAFRDYRDTQMESKEREELYQKLLDEKASVFASHPTFGERVEALSAFETKPDPAPSAARGLLVDPDKTEVEVTEFLTGFMMHLRQQQAAANSG